MRLLGLLLFLLIASPQAAEVASPGPSGVNPGYQEKPDWFRHSFLDLAEDLAESSDQGKRLLLYFHQDGCPYCAKLLQDNFGQKQIAEKTRSRFEVLEINIWGDRELTTLDGRSVSEKTFAQELRVMYTPTMLFLDESGRVLVRLNGYYHPERFSAVLDYASGQAGQGLDFRDFMQRVPVPKAAGEFHQAPFFIAPPYQLSRAGYQADKPLMVLFEQRLCTVCDEMHREHFKRREVLDAVAQLEVVRLDIWGNTPLVTPAGKRTRARDWARELNVKYAPSAVFFDRSGREVFRSEAYLRPFHFEQILRYVATRAYIDQPNFQRYLQGVTERLHEQGIEYDLWQ